MGWPLPSIALRVSFVALILALLTVIVPITLPVAAQTLPARCANGGDYGTTLTIDTTWSEDVYLGRNLTLRNATLTIEPGVTVYFCGVFNLKIGDLFQPGRLVAVGTAEAPIVFAPAPTVDAWGWLYFEDSLDQTSLLQHAILRRGGATAPSNPDAATIYISNRHNQRTLASPLLDQVRVEASASNGIFIYPDVENDPTPPALSRVTITGSARAPLRMAAAAASGLGEGIVTTDNAIERLQVLGDNLLGSMYFNQYWRNHPTPYEILGSLALRNRDPARAFSTWEIAPGTTLLIHENRNLSIGALSNDARLIARGTPDAPITFTRANDQVAQWGQISFNNFSTADSELHWVNLLYGGGAPNESQNYGVLNQTGSGTLTLDHVTIKFSKNAALYAGGNAKVGGFQISDSVFEFNRIGLNLWDARGVVRGSRFSNHSEEAIRNNRANTLCLDAAGNWWGAATGPVDASASNRDACAPAGRSNAGDGERVSDGVIYWPWLQDADGVPQDRSSITPDSGFWIIADGQDQGQLMVTLRDAAGAPLVGKEVRLETTRGLLAQPDAPTDANGRTTATITSTTAGEATITGFNVTDNTPLETQTSVVFWQGPGNTGGLVQAGGTPYARPDLIVEGEPFEVGFPITFRLPLRNTNSTPLDVEVAFRVSNFGIGQLWTPVVTRSYTLAPGESWNAQGGYIPPDTAHRCVAYDVNFTTNTSQALLANSGRFSGQRNPKSTAPPKAPPPECNPNATKLIPRSTGLKGVRKHGKNMQQQMQQVICVLKRNLNIGGSLLASSRTYETLVTPRSFEAQPLLADDEVTTAQAQASTAIATTVAQLNGLEFALLETYERMQQASQAQDWQAALRQTEAYRAFQVERADLLDQLATAADELVSANLAAGEDPGFSPDEYRTYLDELKADGYDAETVAFHRATGLSEAEIAAMLQTEIATLEQGMPTTSTSLNGILRNLATESRATAQALRIFLQPATLAADATTLTTVASNSIPFVVGNPTDSEATVTLIIRPVDLPLHWRASLNQTALRLAAGEQSQAILTLDPGGQPVLQDTDLQVAVEGYINGELIGGVLISQRVPGNVTTTNRVYLPLVQR
ncbi:MAG: hypothetical protein EOM24_01895 [Chloroflexia bacterium]|nr:hypothetical protein [Chloroflexia bacterium]